MAETARLPFLAQQIPLRVTDRRSTRYPSLHPRLLWLPRWGPPADTLGPMSPVTSEEPVTSEDAVSEDAVNADGASVQKAEMLEEELLVEEVSIDGMCGVY